MVERKNDLFSYRAGPAGCGRLIATAIWF